MAGDRIDEAVKGKFGIELQENSRKRLMWFVDHIEGEKILDIGCSQGTLGIMLANQGKKVVAIDNDAESIAYAEENKKNESNEIKQNVTYIWGDFLEYNFDEKYDCIVLGEVLEHVFNPMVFLRKVKDLLKDEGRLLVSVPFGISRHVDHKRTYYMYSLYQQLDTFFCIENISYIGKWIVASAKNSSEKSISIDEKLLEYYEYALYTLEEIKEKREKQLKDTLREESKEMERKYKNTQLLLNQKEEQLKKIIDEKEKLDQEIRLTVGSKEKEIALLESNLREFEKTKKRLETETEQLRKEFEREQNINKMLILEYQNDKSVMEEKILNLSNDILELENSKKYLIEELEKKKEIEDKYIQEVEQVKKDKKIIKDYIKKRRLLDKKNKELEKKYTDLAHSKLGRLQIWYWTKSNKFRRRLLRFEYSIKDFLKKIPLVRRLYYSFQHKKTINAQQNTVTNSKNEEIKDNNLIDDYKKYTDTDFWNRIKARVKDLPESNGGRYYKKSKVKIAFVADEFLYASYKDAAEFLYLKPGNWKEQLENADLLLIASAWKGLSEEWTGIAREGSKKRDLIYSIIDACKEMNKTTVFYSKEDPPNYDRFIEIAKKCNYVFTTCQEIVERYKEDCGHENVGVLCFAINPLYHNPVGMKNKKKEAGVIFSGSWMEKYPERIADLRVLFDGVLNANKELKIIDRNYFLGNPTYFFPKEYWKNVSPSIDHDQLQKVHKLYDWAININSVKNSMTMFANRGYELQAAGNLLISNYSMGVNDKLPYVFTVNDEAEVSEILNNYSSEEVYRQQIAGVRSVMTGETCFDRVNQLLEKIEMPTEEQTRLILVVADKITEHVKNIFDLQSYSNKRLINCNDLTAEEYNAADIVAFFCHLMDYDMFYLEDMANAFKYTNCDYITKDAYYAGNTFVEGKEHEYVTEMKCIYRTLFWRETFSLEEILGFTGVINLPNGYSIDHFNYNESVIVRETREEAYSLSVIVPIYNNGKQLLGKAFSSLQRSSMFADMEIVLVDDGSTDNYTDKVVAYLTKTYENVKSFLFRDGGSGTASRPRNKGAELASAEYITYLDPDNEAINDGYTKLYDVCTNGKYDLVIGNMLRCSDKVTNSNYHKKIVGKYGTDEIFDDGKTLLQKTKFLPMSIQAMVMKKSLVLENNLLQPVGAAGQDTVFSWELVLNAKSIKVIELPIHVYYAVVEGSTVNNIGKRFFEKYYLMEVARRPILEKYGVLEDYMKQRYNHYFVNWTLKKLTMVREEERAESEAIVYKMHEIYEDVYLGNCTEIDAFLAKKTERKSNYS